MGSDGDPHLRRSLSKFLAEAKRRRVFRTTDVYLLGVWAISQGLVELAPRFDVSDATLRSLLIDELFIGRGDDRRVRFYDPLV
jgi:hypothetical protein